MLEPKKADPSAEPRERVRAVAKAGGVEAALAKGMALTTASKTRRADR